MLNSVYIMVLRSCYFKFSCEYYNMNFFNQQKKQLIIVMSQAETKNKKIS